MSSQELNRDQVSGDEITCKCIGECNRVSGGRASKSILGENGSSLWKLK